jgi:hypothetical protein
MMKDLAGLTGWDNLSKTDQESVREHINNPRALQPGEPGSSPASVVIGDSGGKKRKAEATPILVD